jgi:hypothetical protein
MRRTFTAGSYAALFGARPEDVQTHEKHGIRRCVYWLPANDADKTRRAIEEIARGIGLS